MGQDLAKKLDRLSALKVDLVDLDGQYSIRRTEILQPVIAMLETLDKEFDPKRASIQRKIEKMTAAIKVKVVEHGETVSGVHHQAVFNKGRISWDSKMLQGMQMAFPRLREARKEGKPSVSIREVKTTRSEGEETLRPPEKRGGGAIL